MDGKITKEDIHKTIHTVEHPEINATLFELGMIRDVDVSPDNQQVSLTLALPMMGIPEEILHYLVNSLAQATQGVGAKLSYRIAKMSHEERQAFMEKAQRLWKG